MDAELYANISGYLQSVIRMATPLALASIGGMFTARTGIMNFALEGIMIMGAFMGAYGSYLTGNPWFGVLLSIVGGISMALILGFTSVTAKVNQVVAGTGINMLAMGLTSYLQNVIYGIGAKPSTVASFKTIALPLISNIPLIGPVLFKQTVFTYFVYFLVPISAYVIFKTPFGLAMRAVGDYPAAADSLGISVPKIRYISVILSGALGGLSGAFLSIGTLSVFMEKMTSGRGYLAWATVTVGKWNPFGIFGASVLFGAADALQMRLQSLSINFPYQFLVMLPYILTMLVLAG
ncbi:MAG: ABC transporter permease, partial [Clostridia bacterium]